MNNIGSGATWMPLTGIITPGVTNDPTFLGLTAITDPLTGGTRLIAGTFEGVFTGVAGSNGQLIQNIGDVTNVNVASASADVPIITNSRNGDLQIAQFYYGTAQPSNLAAQISGALLYAESAHDSNANSGAPASAPDLLTSGNLVWGSNSSIPTQAAIEFLGGDPGGAVVADPTGAGTIFSYQQPCCGGPLPNFFRVNGIGQTNGLLSAGGPNPDPQWPNSGPNTATTGYAVRQLRRQSGRHPEAPDRFRDRSGLRHVQPGDHVDARCVGGGVGLRRH